jgi:hypothetical protein
MVILITRKTDRPAHHALANTSCTQPVHPSCNNSLASRACCIRVSHAQLPQRAHHGLSPPRPSIFACDGSTATTVTWTPQKDVIHCLELGYTQGYMNGSMFIRSCVDEPLASQIYCRRVRWEYFSAPTQGQCCMSVFQLHTRACFVVNVRVRCYNNSRGLPQI